MFLKPLSKYSKLTARTFSSSKTGGNSSTSGVRGGSESNVGSTNQTSNAPNYGTSNNSGGRFSGSPNQNMNGASNTTSPSSASKATSTSGTSQASGTGTGTLNNKSNPKTVDNSSIPNASSKDNTAKDASSTGGFTNFIKSAFGKANPEGTTNSTSTESSNPNRPSIPKNDSPFVATTESNVQASPKDRTSGSVGNPNGSANSGHLGSHSGPSANAPHHSNAPKLSADYERARSELQFDSVGVRYAYLLWSMYKEQNALDKLDSDLETFYNSVDTEESLQKIFAPTKLMTESNRETELEKYLAKGKVSDKMEAFLRTVTEMRRLADLRVIFDSVHSVRERIERSKHTAVVTSAHPLSDNEKASIRKTIEATFKPSGPVDIEEQIKPELGGGYEIYYDGKYHLDNSRKSLVSELEDEVDSAIASFISKRGAGESAEGVH